MATTTSAITRFSQLSAFEQRAEDRIRKDIIRFEKMKLDPGAALGWTTTQFRPEEYKAVASDVSRFFWALKDSKRGENSYGLQSSQIALAWADRAIVVLSDTLSSKDKTMLHSRFTRMMTTYLQKFVQDLSNIGQDAKPTLEHLTAYVNFTDAANKFISQAHHFGKTIDLVDGKPIEKYTYGLENYSEKTVEEWLSKVREMNK